MINTTGILPGAFFGITSDPETDPVKVLTSTGDSVSSGSTLILCGLFSWYGLKSSPVNLLCALRDRFNKNTLFLNVALYIASDSPYRTNSVLSSSPYCDF